MKQVIIKVFEKVGTVILTEGGKLLYNIIQNSGFDYLVLDFVNVRLMTQNAIDISIGQLYRDLGEQEFSEKVRLVNVYPPLLSMIKYRIGEIRKDGERNSALVSRCTVHL